MFQNSGSRQISAIEPILMPAITLYKRFVNFIGIQLTGEMIAHRKPAGFVRVVNQQPRVPSLSVVTESYSLCIFIRSMGMSVNGLKQESIFANLIIDYFFYLNN